MIYIRNSSPFIIKEIQFIMLGPLLSFALYLIDLNGQQIQDRPRSNRKHKGDTVKERSDSIRREDRRKD